MRDDLKDKAYFEDKHAKDLMRFKKACDECAKALARLAEEGDAFKGNIEGYYDTIVIRFQYKFYSGYSLGLSIQELKADIPLLVGAIQNSWNGEVYADMEFMLYLAIIFEIARSDIKPALDLMIKYDYQDLLLDSMAHHIDPSFTIRADGLKFKKSSSAIVKIIQLAKTSKEEAVAKLASFLNNGWLNLQTGGIINNQQHLKKDKYRGYWSIESAALVKMLNLDDEILKDCKYYPYDLLH